MTQYLLSVYGGVDDKMPPPEDVEKMYADTGAFNEKLREAGLWVFAGGLMPVDSATTVDGTGAEALVVDGPYTESKEYLGGFWIIEAPDLDSALKWAAEGSAACQGKVEVRPFQSE